MPPLWATAGLSARDPPGGLALSATPAVRPFRPDASLRTPRPKLKSIEAFDAVSRHLDLRDAAAELGVTPSALSHHLKYLDEAVGEPLSVRARNGVTLTARGETVARRVQASLTELSRAFSETEGRQASVIRLAVCTSFGPGWVVRRLGAFRERWPDVDLQLMMFARKPDLTDAVADAFITLDDGHAGFWSVPILKETMVAVCRAELVADRRRQPLIAKVSDGPNGRHTDWTAYLDATDRPDDFDTSIRPISASHHLMAYEIAKQGLGIAIVPDFLASDDVQSGVMAILDGRRIPSGRTYHLSVRDARRREAGVAAVVTWIRANLGERDE